MTSASQGQSGGEELAERPHAAEHAVRQHDPELPLELDGHLHEIERVRGQVVRERDVSCQVVVADTQGIGDDAPDPGLDGSGSADAHAAAPRLFGRAARLDAARKAALVQPRRAARTQTSGRTRSVPSGHGPSRGASLRI